MRKRVTKLAAAIAAIAAFAAGGAALATGAGTGSPPAPPAPAQAQQGGQVTDAQATDQPAGEAPDNEAGSPADTDTVQQGDQTMPDTAGASQEEQATEATTDSPGGYADTVPNAYTQQEGEH